MSSGEATAISTKPLNSFPDELPNKRICDTIVLATGIILLLASVILLWTSIYERPFGFPIDHEFFVIPVCIGGLLIPCTLGIAAWGGYRLYQYFRDKKANERIQQAFQSNTEPSQDDLTAVLAFEINDYNCQHVAKYFPRLDLKHQVNLCYEIGGRAQLTELLHHLPKEMTKLGIHLGASNPNNPSSMALEVPEIMKELLLFKKLDVLYVQLFEVCFTANLSSHLQAMITLTNNNQLDTYPVPNDFEDYYVHGISKPFPNNGLATLHALKGILQCLKTSESASVQVTIYFSDKTISLIKNGAEITWKTL